MSAATEEKKANARKPTAKDATINLRLSLSDRALIDNAASIKGQTRSDFMIESARSHAIDVLLDQRLFALDDEQFEAFRRALDEPAPENKKLKALLAKKPLWQK